MNVSRMISPVQLKPTNQLKLSFNLSAQHIHRCQNPSDAEFLLEPLFLHHGILNQFLVWHCQYIREYANEIRKLNIGMFAHGKCEMHHIHDQENGIVEMNG